VSTNCDEIYQIRPKNYVEAGVGSMPDLPELGLKSSASWTKSIKHVS